MVSREQVLLTVVTATALEYREARKVLPANITVIRAGISMQRERTRIDGLAISCGLAGGLRDNVATGTVLIPRTVTRPDGTSISCDLQACDTLEEAAHALDLKVLRDPLVTTPHFVCGVERAQWAARGYAGTDMESGLIDSDRLACVRVVLDTPAREISQAWLDGMRAALTPRAWLDLPFLAKNGPRCARTAAAVIGLAIQAARL